MISAKFFLGEADMTDAHFIRREVFIKEQGISENAEMDGTDGDALHLVAYENGMPLATARARVVDGKLMIGRVAVLKEHRQRGLGDFVMRILTRKSFEAGHEEQFVHAQTAARKFYERLGFTAFGEEFMEDGIPHVHMVHKGDIFSCDH